MQKRKGKKIREYGEGVFANQGLEEGEDERCSEAHMIQSLLDQRSDGLVYHEHR